MLLEKVAQLEDLCVKKEKFIQSNKMIVKFREDHITRLEKLHKEAHGSFLPSEQEKLFGELKEELKILREQVAVFLFNVLPGSGQTSVYSGILWQARCPQKAH